jgi:hypothetical protein
LRPDSARNGASGQNDGGEECEFDAVGGAVADAVAAEKVLYCISSGRCGSWEREKGRDMEKEKEKELTREPTVTPAATEGTEPVRA